MPEAMPTETISDKDLLRRYAEGREPEAFAELARRHAGLVYGTCLRITSSPQDAEELAQDCFLQLARRAAGVRTSVAGWLHRLATHRALNSLRARGRRLRREALAAREVPPVPDGATPWREIEPLLDEAIAELPEALRAAIVMHFLEEQPQSAVAARLGVDQSTVSRRIKEGLARLQRQLRRSGVVLSGMPLATLISAHAPQAGQQTDLIASLGKIALAGGATAPATIKLSTWGMAALAATGPILVQLIAGGWHGFLTALAVVLYIGLRRPAWFDEFAASFGSSERDRDFFPLRRWTWTTLPAHWPEALAASLLASVMLGGIGITFLLTKPDASGIAAMMILFALIPLTTAARIIARLLAATRAGTPPPKPKPVAAPPNVGDVAQAIAFAVAGTLMAASVARLAAQVEDSRSPFAGLAIFMAIAMLWCWGDAALKVVRRRRAAAIRGTSDELETPEPAAPSPARPKAAMGIILYLLATSALFTAYALAQHLGLVQVYPSNRAVAAVQRQVAVGLLPNLSLFWLIGAARALSRLRPSGSSAAWLALAAIASLCATLDIALIASWLLGLSW